MSEEGVASFFNEVMGSDRLRRGLGRAGEKFLCNKQAFDRNIETMLDFVNLPSKKDVRELKARLDHLSGQLLNLNVKLDRVLAAEPPKKEDRAAARPARRRRGAKPGP